MRIFLAIVIFAACCSAKDVYISESGAGAQDGAACASAHTMAWFNDQSNWSQTADANKIAWGDTVHLCGTITSQVSFTGAGNGGTAYTLYWEPGCVVEAGVFTGNGWYHAAGRTYFTLDGGVNGVIRCTNSGSPGQGLTSTNGSSPAIKLTSPNNGEIKNLIITNIYVRNRGPWTQAGAAIEIIDEGQNGGFHNWTISNCVVSHAIAGVLMSYGTNAKNILVTGNTFSNVNWGAQAGDAGATSLLSNYVFSYNRVHTFTNWDGTEVDALTGARGAFHHNGVYIWAESGGTCKNLTFVGNHIGPNFSYQTDGSPQATGGIFISGAGMLGPVLIANNVVESGTDPYDVTGNGFFALGMGNNCVIRVFNNTLVAATQTATSAIELNGSFSAPIAYVSNNIVVRKTGVRITSWSGGGTANVDYNIGYDLPPSAQYSYSTTSSSDFKTLAQWRALGYDTHGATNQNPLMTSTWSLGSGSPAIGAGVEINSIFTIDKVGVTRGSVWDAGAFEFVAPDLTRTVNVSGTLRVGTMTVP